MPNDIDNPWLDSSSLSVSEIWKQEKIGLGILSIYDFYEKYYLKALRPNNILLFSYGNYYKVVWLLREVWQGLKLAKWKVICM